MEQAVGYIIAALIGLVAGVVISQVNSVREKRGIAAAIAGEISGIVNNVETRGLDDYFRRLVPLLRSPTPPPPPWAHFNPAQESCPVYKANIGKIGALGPHLSGRVVRFYALFEAIRTEVIILAGGAYDAAPVNAAVVVERTLALWDQVEPLAGPLIVDLFALSGEQPD